MNVWIFSPYEQYSGQTSRNYDFAIRLVERGHSVTVVTNNFCHRTHKRFIESTDGEFEETDVQGVRVIWLNTSEYHDNGIQRAWNAVSFFLRGLRCTRLATSKPDAVIGDSVPPTAGLIAYLFARRFRAKFIFQIRDVWPIALVYDGALSKRNPLFWGLRIVEKFLYRRAYRICSTVPNLFDHVRESGASADKVVWVPNGVDLARFPSSSVNRSRGEDGTVRVAYAGGYGNAHDVMSIVKAAEILSNRGVTPEFTFYGDGVKRSGCEQYARERGLSKVVFREVVPRAEIPEILMQSDILVVAVTDSDAYKFGINLNKVYDYFAAGRPIVFSCRTTDDPVARAECGASVYPERPDLMADAIERLVAKGMDGRRRLGLKARQYAEDYYDVEKLVDNFEAMLT